MNFSKKTLFAAALFASSAVVASAVSEDLNPERDISGNITVENDFSINLDGNTITMNGAFLSVNGSMAEQSAVRFTQNANNPLLWYIAEMADDQLRITERTDTQVVTIAGGGSLTYTGGTVGSGYYTDSYQMNRASYPNMNPTDAANVWDAWKSMDSFWSAGNFTGKLIVGSDTTLNAQGQLSQYVTFVKPTMDGVYSSVLSGFLGVQAIELKDGATLSFAGSKKNMVNSRPNLTTNNPQDNYNPTAILSLNFVNNITSTSDSRIVIGNDEGSINRIVFNTYTGKESTVGRLVGNGRIYTTGMGTISFIGVSELNPGSNVDASGSADTTGNTWISGNKLADIVLGTKIANVGSADGGKTVVDNVFANATAVHLVSSLDVANVNLTFNASAGDDLANSAQGGTLVNAGSCYLSNFATVGADDYTVVNVYGNQVFNNFQSLWIERSALLSDPEVGDPKSQVYEPVSFARGNNRSTGSYTSVVLNSGAVLTIDQDKGRDGIYYGTLDTSDGGLIVKTGQGRFIYRGDDTIKRLRIEEGEWLFSGAFDTAVTLAKGGQLTIGIGEPETASFTIQAIDTSSVLRLLSSYEAENDLTADALEAVKSGDYTEDALQYRKVRYSQQGGADNARSLQISAPQTLFYGKVLVEDGVTLQLGSEGSSESVFSGASSIELIGAEAPDAGQWKASILSITGTQLVRNLKGGVGSSAVRISKSGTLVLTNNDEAISYVGGFSGEGSLVKLGALNQRVTGNGFGELTGTLSVLAGSVSVDQTSTSVGVAGLILKSGTTASFGNYAKVGALIGEAGTAVSVSEVLTVGGNAKPTGDGDGSYFATSNYGAYDSLFGGTALEPVLTNLKNSVETARLYQPETAASSVGVTTAGTLAYLKNPAKLVYTTSTDKLDGAFAKLFTSTGVDRSGNNIFAKMSEASTEVFGGAKTVAEWLRNVFTTEKVGAFISSAGTELSEAQKQSLTTLAQTITEREAGVKAYLDSNGNLNANGWNTIVAAAGLEYLKAEYGTAGTGWVAKMTDDSLYTFITAFYADYEFVLTQDVATQIGQIYGVDSSRWVVGTNADYQSFINSFGLDSSVFAGTINGSGALVKIGPETLTLTGQNSYTGITKVESGELAVDWNSIQRTSGVTVEQGALLTISAMDGDIYEAYKDPETGSDSVYEKNEGYGAFFTGTKSNNTRLSGKGTVVKLGDGKVDLGAALKDVVEGSSDFAGNFLVANGALKATVDPVARTAAQTPLAFNIYFSKEKTPGSVVTDPAFELVFKRTDGFGYIVGTRPAELEFTGTITGKKEGETFVLDAGVSRPNLEVASVNNILTVGSEKLSVSNINIKSGTLNVAVSGSGDWFDTATLAANAGLKFSLLADATLADATVSGQGGKLTVTATEQDYNDAYIVKTLTLNNGQLTGISSLDLVGGATLILGGTGPANGDDVVLTALSTDAQTVLEIGANRKVELEGSGTIAGTLAGSGKLIFNGESDSTLTLGNTEGVRETSAFGGEIEFNGGSIVFAAGNGQTVSYNGLKISGSDVGLDGRKLVKEGTGTVSISKNGSNNISVKDLAIEVNAGVLAVSGDLFSQDGKLPTSLAIAADAKFTFTDEFSGTGFDLGALGKLSGTGTLAFDLNGAKTVTVSEFNAAAFSGVVEITQADTTLQLGSGVKEFAAFSGAGTVKVDDSVTGLTVRVNANDDGAEKFQGKITGTHLDSLTVVGGGALVFASKDSVPVSTINVGTLTENGGVGVAPDWAGTIIAVGTSSAVLVDGGSFAGTVEVRNSVESLSLARSGNLVLGGDAVSTSFNLKDEDSNRLKLDGSRNVTLANIAGSTLTLQKLSALNEEVFNLKTNVGGGLVFDGPAVSGLRNLASSTQAEWAKDISGAGGITLKNGADLKLSAGVLSYTGATVVSGNSTLEYGSGTVSQSSSLTIETGSTLVGGVDLVAKGSNVVFENGSHFKFTGDAVRFTGTGSAEGIINVTLDADALNARGVPVAIIETLGENALNKITWNNLRIDDSTTSLKYLKSTEGTSSDSLVIYVATDNLSAIPGVDIHEGLSKDNLDYLSSIATPERGALKSGLSAAEAKLAEAIIKTPNGSLAGTLNNLSPLSYGAMLALPQSGFISDMAAISARIEQRRYDSYTQFAWEIHDDWEFFAQAQGSLAQADEGKPDTRTFDMNTYGAIAGMDVKMNATTVAGFSVAYDYGKADIHNAGGDIQSHNARATAFIGKLVENQFYIDAGAQIGYAMFDVKRNTVLGGVDGTANGWHAGVFANAGMLMPLYMSEDEKTSVNLMPYFGLAYSYYGVGAFDESGAETALDTDAFGASSLRATIGASLAWVTPCFGKNSRWNLDLAYTRELMDSEADIDYAMPGMNASDTFTASAKTFAEDSFSIGPRFSYDLDRDNSIYAGYRFEFSTDSDTAHSVNLGFRSRF